MSHVYPVQALTLVHQSHGELRMAVCPSAQRRKVKQVCVTNVRNDLLRQGVQRCIGEKTNHTRCWQLKITSHTALFIVVVCQLFDCSVCHPDFDPNKTGSYLCVLILLSFSFLNIWRVRIFLPANILLSFSCWRSGCPRRGVDMKMLMYSGSSGSVYI